MAAGEPTPKAPRGAKSRPWYLAGALVAASVFGLSGWLGGCQTITYYTETRVDSGSRIETDSAGSSEEEREGLKVRADRVLDARDAAKNRLFPIGVAVMLVGGAIFFVGFRAMSGRLTARNMLLQLIAAQAALGVASYSVTGELRRADVDYTRAALLARPHADATPDEHRINAAVVRALTGVMHPVSLGLQTLASLLIIVALTRPRSREFFDAPSDVLHER